MTEDELNRYADYIVKRVMDDFDITEIHELFDYYMLDVVVGDEVSEVDYVISKEDALKVKSLIKTATCRQRQIDE